MAPVPSFRWDGGQLPEGRLQDPYRAVTGANAIARCSSVAMSPPAGAINISTVVRMSPVSADRCDLLCLDLEKAERLRAHRLDSIRAEFAAAQAKALGDPTRLRLAAALAEGDELCVCDLAWVLERAENLVSHHLRQLRSAGLVASRRQGKMVIYRLTKRGRELVDLGFAHRMPA
jgi:ArsR family transcriptional regulator, lead/cadmium/zinc/bismuth-responsive transcriptional repressor